MEELEALAAMNLYSSSVKKWHSLIKFFGSAKNVLNNSLQDLIRISGIEESILKKMKETAEQTNWKKEFALLDRIQGRLIPFNGTGYPKRLLSLPDPPLLLYCVGKIIEEDQKCIAIIGARNATPYGLEIARKLGRELSAAGFTIVSGLARGIDTEAHWGALEKGRTIAVLGSGLTHIYPYENEQLAHVIQQNGALLTEYEPLSPPNRAHFPKRNRIVSGMTLGTVLIEASLKSGSMVTAELARRQGRPLFVFPGKRDHASFRGNQELLNEKKGILIESGEELIKYFNYNFLYT